MLGAYTKSMLQQAFAIGRLKAEANFYPNDVGPASVDLTFAGPVYQVENFSPPSARRAQSVQILLDEREKTEVSFGETLFPGKTYVGKASVSANFSPGIFAYANAKSTSGRNFLLVRTVADSCGGYDSIDHRNTGYTGDIYLVVEPLVFPVILTAAECYNQIRLFNADTKFNEQDLRETLATSDLLYDLVGNPLKQDQLPLGTNSGDVMMTLHAPCGEVVGYRAKQGNKPLRLDAPKGSADPRDYFEPIYAEKEFGSSFVRLKAGQYYLLSTHEMIKIPTNLCAEMKPLDPRLGLFFSHFAGFFDPGFFGAVTLEVTPLVDMSVRHRDPVANFKFEKLAGTAPSYADNGNYHQQKVVTLPKQFSPFPTA